MALPSTSQSPIDEDSTTSNCNGRHVRHRTRACFNCSKVKKRCKPNSTGPEESCSRCLETGQICVFPYPEDDGRSRPHTSTMLRARVVSLERQLREMKIFTSILNGQICRAPKRAITMDKLTTEVCQKLVLDPSGVRSYGPPSPYYHSSPSSSQLELDPQSPTPPTTPYPSHHQHDEFWWRVYLPEHPPLSRQEHEQLIELFFQCFAIWGSRDDSESFYSAMWTSLSSSATMTSSSAHYGPMLHNAMLAIAMAFSPDPRLNSLDARWVFVKKAQAYLTDEMESPTLSGVLALSYLSSFFMGIGHCSAASSHFAMCSTWTQILGLGIDTSHIPRSFMSDREKRERKWLFWVVFCQDKNLALHLGRNVCIASPKYPQSVALSHEADEDRREIIQSQRALFLVTADMLKTIYHRRRVTHEMIDSIIKAVDSWVEHVPHHLRVSDPILDGISYTRYQLVLFLTYAWIKICLHKRFYRRSTMRCVAWTNIAVQESDLAANRILELIRAYNRLHDLRHIPLCAVSIAFLAGVIFIFKAERLRDFVEERRAAMWGLEEIKTAMAIMAITWQCAGHALDILERYNRKLNPELGGLASSNIELDSHIIADPFQFDLPFPDMENFFFESPPIPAATYTTRPELRLNAEPEGLPVEWDMERGVLTFSSSHPDSIVNAPMQSPYLHSPENRSFLIRNWETSDSYAITQNMDDYGSFVGADLYNGQFAGVPFTADQGTSTLLQPQPDTSASMHDSPPSATLHLPYEFNGTELGPARADPYSFRGTGAGAGWINAERPSSDPYDDRHHSNFSYTGDYQSLI